MLTNTELENFNGKLTTRKIQIEKNLQDTTLELNEMRDLELNDEGDFAATSAKTIIDSAILVQQRKELNEIELALDKIKQRTYGVCEMCEEPIGLARLEVKNFARFCMPCREINEKEEK
ncbi:MAG: RNA polymerase-binding protein DksA [Epsilonproteobacteria bacterium]|nr:MAG: RNA polymerase-binding protein DksA [Campylobacterota bacterium]